MRSKYVGLGEVIHRKSPHDEASHDSEAKQAVVATYSTARIQADGAKKRVVRDRTDQDRPALVSYVFLSGCCNTADEAWQQALESMFP
jgi:hypothetical protein